MTIQSLGSPGPFRSHRFPPRIKVGRSYLQDGLKARAEISRDRSIRLFRSDKSNLMQKRSSSQATLEQRGSHDVFQSPDPNVEGKKLYALVEALYPICRSITGNGLRQSLRLLQKTVPLKLHEVPSGSQVFDWVVPKEWNIRDAYIKNAADERVVDFRTCNLHVLNYSVRSEEHT